MSPALLSKSLFRCYPAFVRFPLFFRIRKWLKDCFNLIGTGHATRLLYFDILSLTLFRRSFKLFPTYFITKLSSQVPRKSSRNLSLNLVFKAGHCRLHSLWSGNIAYALSHAWCLKLSQKLPIGTTLWFISHGGAPRIGSYDPNKFSWFKEAVLDGVLRAFWQEVSEGWGDLDFPFWAPCFATPCVGVDGALSPFTDTPRMRFFCWINISICKSSSATKHLFLFSSNSALFEASILSPSFRTRRSAEASFFCTASWFLLSRSADVVAADTYMVTYTQR